MRNLGKSLPLKVYGLISYIENNILNDTPDDARNNGQGNKAKIMRETKHIPKLIFCIEKFNNSIILLDKKSKSQELSVRLHLGTVRDFRFKTDDLRKAVDQTFQDGESSSDNDDVSDETDVDNDT